MTMMFKTDGKPSSLSLMSLMTTGDLIGILLLTAYCPDLIRPSM